MSDPTPPATTPATQAKPAKKKVEMAQTSVSLPPDLLASIQARADHEERTLTVVIRRLLTAGMEGYDPNEDD